MHEVFHNWVLFQLAYQCLLVCCFYRNKIVPNFYYEYNKWYCLIQISRSKFWLDRLDKAKGLLKEHSQLRLHFSKIQIYKCNRCGIDWYCKCRIFSVEILSKRIKFLEGVKLTHLDIKDLFLTGNWSNFVRRFKIPRKQIVVMYKRSYRSQHRMLGRGHFGYLQSTITTSITANRRNIVRFFSFSH